MLHTGKFNSGELIKIDEGEYVILASGGPLMKLVCIEGDNALCEWDEQRRLFPVACLRRLVRLTEH